MENAFQTDFILGMSDHAGFSPLTTGRESRCVRGHGILNVTVLAHVEGVHVLESHMALSTYF